MLFGNIARAMGDAPKEIKVRHIGNCLKADPAYGEGVAKAMASHWPRRPQARSELSSRSKAGDVTGARQ